MEFQLIRRFDFDPELVSWADMILTAGGDGTFLMAASKVLCGSKPVVGINTDPIRYTVWLPYIQEIPSSRVLSQ